jgi:uncharacterized protein YjiS (DUF1127 family)
MFRSALIRYARWRLAWEASSGLKALDDRTLEDIGIPRHTIRSRVREAIDRLRRR